jgi:hypothetical protein
MLDRIGRNLKAVAPEHFEGYLNGWLDVNSWFDNRATKWTQVKSKDELLLEIKEFATDRRTITQVFHNGKIIETTIL